MTSAQCQPMGAMKMPHTAAAVANNLVATADQNKMGAGRDDQNGPRVRVMKMVRWPATVSLRNMNV